MSSISKQFFINQLVWIGLSFPISLVAVLGILLFLNSHLRRSMITKYGSVLGDVMEGMYSPTMADGSSLKYCCMRCGTHHKETSCPN